ncbi:MAG: hypothetical protein FJ290_23700, partial [Planctomycetes bacterium]|nr:hypothetical protein [Planctomycetota bacterium]
MDVRQVRLAAIVVLSGAACAAGGGLVARYDFANDASDPVGGFHAKVIGGAAVADDPGGNGKGPGTVLHLPTDDAFARCEAPQLSLKGSFAITLWLKAHYWWRTPGPHAPRPSDIGDDYDGIVAGPGFALSRAYSDLRFEAGGLTVSVPHRKLGRWHHIAAVCQAQPPDAAKGRQADDELEPGIRPADDKAGQIRTWEEKRTLHLYVDGELAASITKQVALNDLPRKQDPKPVPLAIGGMEGFLDDVRLYDTALPMEAIATVAERRFAREEHPIHGFDAVDPGTALVWKPGAGAVSHDVYFGADPAELRAATRQSRCFKGNQTATTYKPQGLEPGGRAYCWRVDEVEADGTVSKGGVMEFTTGTLAFPGAQGCGAFARGGRGGKVLFVTNLDDYDPKAEKPIPGSLRAACAEKGPRIVVFRISGTIALKADLVITEPYLTIAGQTAPGDGICVKMRHSQISSHDVIVRHIRFRPGDEFGAEGFAKIKGTFECDALRLLWAQRVIVDHCSFSWALDETMDIWDSSDVTVQWSILAESLA